jgi:hypothetical protein
MGNNPSRLLKEMACLTSGKDHEWKVSQCVKAVLPVGDAKADTHA